jgi:nucleoside-diphosphate-sugar epimerase
MSTAQPVDDVDGSTPLEICVVGGSRFFGARLVSRLVDAGHRVTVLNRGLAADSHGDRVQRLRADANDETALRAAVAGHRFDVVVHQMIYTPHAALAAAAAFAGHAERLIMTSTIEVYAGAASPPGGWAESDLDPATIARGSLERWLEPAFAEANYGLGKCEAESALVAAAGMPVTIVRVGHVLGAGEFTGRLDWFVERARRGIPVADGAVSSFVHVDDIARFFAWLVEHPIDGAVNAAAQPPLAPAEIAAAVAPPSAHASAGDAERSPFHFEHPFVMSTERALAAGFRFRPSQEWLPQLAVAHA